jgi:putative transposase
LPELLEALGLARSSYFYHRARLQVAEKYIEVRRAMADIFERNHRCYGYRRMQASPTRHCMGLSEKVVQRLMKQERLIVATPKRRRYGSWGFVSACIGKICLARQTLYFRV